MKEEPIRQERSRKHLWSAVAVVALLPIGLTAASVPQDVLDAEAGMGYQHVGEDSEDGAQIVNAADTARESWPYVELDVEEVRKQRHAGHHEGSCAYGSFSAIIGLLQDEIGAPYDQIPTYMLHFGRGAVQRARGAGGGNLLRATFGVWKQSLHVHRGSGEAEAFPLRVAAPEPGMPQLPVSRSFVS